jgi:hypothetical protein
MSKVKKGHPDKGNKDIGSKVTDSAQHQEKQNKKKD